MFFKKLAIISLAVITSASAFGYGEPWNQVSNTAEESYNPYQEMQAQTSPPILSDRSL